MPGYGICAWIRLRCSRCLSVFSGDFRPVRRAEVFPMDVTPPKTPARRPPSRISLSPAAAILLAVSFGLCGGYLDLGFIVFKRFCWNPEGSFRAASDFPWTVPVGHAVLMLIPGVV